jgi:putative nucleotidyltransferase with HDIG domain
VVLGLNNIKNIVLSTAVIDGFSASPDSSGLDRKAFWEHSLACAIVSRKLSLHMGMKNSEEVFMWGLLHDLGKIILDIYFHDDFIRAVTYSHEKQVPLKDSETRIFGFNHTGVGALLLRKWSMPLSLVKAVAFHHSPEEDHSAFRMAAIVHAADYLCRRIGIGSGGDTLIPELNKKAWKLMGIKSDQLRVMSRDILNEYKAATAFLTEGP